MALFDPKILEWRPVLTWTALRLFSVRSFEGISMVLLSSRKLAQYRVDSRLRYLTPSDCATDSTEYGSKDTRVPVEYLPLRGHIIGGLWLASGLWKAPACEESSVATTRII